MQNAYTLEELTELIQGIVEGYHLANKDVVMNYVITNREKEEIAAVAGRSIGAANVGSAIIDALKKREEPNDD